MLQTPNSSCEGVWWKATRSPHLSPLHCTSPLQLRDTVGVTLTWIEYCVQRGSAVLWVRAFLNQVAVMNADNRVWIFVKVLWLEEHSNMSVQHIQTSRKWEFEEYMLPTTYVIRICYVHCYLVAHVKMLDWFSKSGRSLYNWLHLNGRSYTCYILERGVDSKLWESNPNAMRYFSDYLSCVIVVLGGAGLGSAIGLVAHYARTVSGDPPPKVEIPSFPLPWVSPD